MTLSSRDSTMADRPEQKNQTVSLLDPHATLPSAASMPKPLVMLVVRWPVGGIRTYIRYILSHVDFQAYRYLLIAPDRAEVHELVAEFASLDIQLMATVDKTSALARQALQCLLKRPVQLVHSHGFSSGIAVALIARTKGVPHLMTSHDVLQSSQFIGFKGQLKRQALAVNFKFINLIQSVGHEAQANLKAMLPSLKPAQLTTVVNGVDVQRFADAIPRDVRAEQVIQPQQLVLGFMGRFMAQKGFIYLVQAMQQLSTTTPAAQMPIVVAVGSGDFIREDTALIKARGLFDYFRFIPFESDVGGLLKGVDVVVMPSLWEACPLLPMEAMAAGIPVLGTDCVGLNEVLTDTPNQRLPAGDTNALTQAIQRLNEDRQVLQTWQLASQAYQATAMQRFDIQATAEAVGNLYQRLLPS